jgi:hypothetical protein
MGTLVAAVMVGLAVPAAAPAETTCWQKVLAAWSAGTLGPNFPVHCYQAAVNNLPDDLQGYSSAADDIQRALLAAIHHDATRTMAGAHAKQAGDIVAAAPVGSSGRSWPPLALLVLAGGVVLLIAAGVGSRRRTRR